MKENDIVLIVKGISKRLKDKGGKIHDIKWHSCYEEQCQIAEDISVHAQKNKFPEKMMKTKAPNETEVELKYRKDNFESITMPYWYRAVSSVSGRIWNEQNHTITINDDEVKEYLFKEFPVYKSIIDYFKAIVTPYKINDPNAVLALKINDFPTKEDEEGNEVIDDSEQLSPSLQVYACSKIIDFDLGKYCIVMSDAKTEIEFGNRKVKEGFVFYLYDKENIWKIYQTGKKVDWTFAIENYFNHGLGYLPCWKLKGILKTDIKDDDNDLIYYSYFTPAIPLLNKALKQDSTLDASVSKTAFPVRTYYEDECSEPTCQGGKVLEYEDGKENWRTCGKCNGTGKGGVTFSPLKDHVLRPPRKTVTDEEVQLPFPAFAYVSPDTTILEFLDNKIKSEIVEAFTFINIDVSNKGDNTGSQTAIEVKIDREELFAFLKQFSHEIFDLFKKSVEAILKIRYQNTDSFSVNPPKTFEIYGAEELTFELGEAKKAGVPEIGIREITREYMGQRFSQQGDLPKIVELVFKVDGYATKDTTEISILKSSNLIQLWQAILHEEIYQFIDELMEENKDFLAWDLMRQKSELEKLAKARASELTPNTAANIINEIAGVE